MYCYLGQMVQNWIVHCSSARDFTKIWFDLKPPSFIFPFFPSFLWQIVIQKVNHEKAKSYLLYFLQNSNIFTNSKLRHRRILCLRFQGFVLFFPLSFLPSFADVHCLWGFTSSRSWTMVMWWGFFQKYPKWWADIGRWDKNFVRHLG